MSYQQIKSLKEGDEVTQIFLLADIKRGETKNGKPYGNVILRDSTGQISCKLWDFDPHDYPEFTVGAYAKLTIEIENFRGARQAKSKSAPMIVPTPKDLSVYESSKALTRAKAEYYYDQLMVVKNQVKHNLIKFYLDLVFDDKAIKEEFIDAPDSVSNRGAYRGGLVEHVYKVMRNAEALIESQKQANITAPVNEEIVIAGVLMHDIGKMRSYKVDSTGVSYTRAGQLLDHLPMSYGISCEYFLLAEQELGVDIPQDIKDHINHCILAHHGLLEYGSPVKPRSIEAQIIHTADMADSTVSQFAEVTVDNLSHVTQDGFVEGTYFTNKTVYVGNKKIDG